MHNMAIVKASFTRQSGTAKAAIRYIQNRSGKDGAKISRTLFNADGLMGRFEAYRMINEAEQGSYFFRFVISPDPKQEDTGKDLFLREITEKTIFSLEDRRNIQLQWVAAIHSDHAPHRHMHVIAIVLGRLQVQDFQVMRQTATEAALEQRHQRDLALAQQAQQREAAQWER